MSVVVPVYNVSGYLDMCIQSICRQSYKNLDIILVDDGSTDGSGIICDVYGAKDHRIQVIHQSNAGLVAARKTGILAAKGEYVGFVDSDDYIEPCMYEMMLENIQDADFIHTGYYENSMKVILHNDEMVELSKEKTCKMIHCLLTGNGDYFLTPSIWSKLFRRDLIRKCYLPLPEEQSYGEDVLCLCAVLYESCKIVLSSGAYYHYRMRNESLSHCAGTDNIRKEISLYHHLVCILDRYQLAERFRSDADYFLRRQLFQAFRKMSHPFAVEQYSFGDLSVLSGKKIILYGAGSVGKDYYGLFCRYKECEVVAWTDGNYGRYHYANIKLTSPEHIGHIDYDFIIIGVLHRNAAQRITEDLCRQGVSRKKIMWRRPVDMLMDDACFQSDGVDGFED